MKKALGLVFLLALVAMPTLAQKVTVDYAHDFDSSGVKTFQYVDTRESNSKNELMAGRIEELIKKELREGGLTEVQENPDLYVTYHVTTEEMSSFNTASMGYGGYGGYGPGWGGYGRYGYGGYGGMASTTTYETKFTDKNRKCPLHHSFVHQQRCQYQRIPEIFLLLFTHRVYDCSGE